MGDPHSHRTRNRLNLLNLLNPPGTRGERSNHILTRPEIGLTRLTSLTHPGLAHDDRSNHVLTGPVVRTARMCVLPPTLPLHHACNVASNEAEAPGFGYEQVRGSGFDYE